MNKTNLIFAILLSCILFSCNSKNNYSQKYEDLKLNAINSTSSEKLIIFQDFELGSTIQEFNFKLDSLMLTKTIWNFSNSILYENRRWRRVSDDLSIESFLSNKFKTNKHSLKEDFRSGYNNLLDNYQDEYLIVRNSPVSLPYDYKEYVSMIYYVNNEDTIIRKSHVHFEPYFTLKDSILFKFEMAIQLYNQDEHIYILDLYRKKYGDPRNNSWFINQHEINYKIEDINKDFKFLLINYRNLKIEEEDISYRNKINELRQSERRIIDSIENEKVKKINSTKKKIVGTQKI